MYEAYHTAGSPVKKMSKYYNVIKPSLITPADLSQPPELHLHIGLANWVWDIVKLVLGEDKYSDLVQWSHTGSIMI